jgi:predicted esterase
VIERTIATTTHGRYAVVPPASGAGGAPMLVGFHGYAESADTQLERLRQIPGSDRWLIVSIQGLHRFYQRRTNEVIASWMTRQNRDLAIADNLSYVAAVVHEAMREWAAAPRAVFAGFSQGVAMTFRAAASAPVPVTGVVAAGGDVPPEIDVSGLARVGSALLCRGTADEWYTTVKFTDDARRLREAGVRVQALEFEGGHVWSGEVVSAAAEFLRAHLT